MIRADKRTMSSLSQLEIMEMREEGDAFILKVNMFGYESACANVWCIMGHSEIMEPLELRQYVKGQLSFLQGIYD